MIQDFEEKESLLLRKIAGLELAKEQIEEGAVSDLEQLLIEITCSFVPSFRWSAEGVFDAISVMSPTNYQLHQA